MQLDKDILLKGNKIYGPETCVFVTQELNLTFPVRSKYRGKWPIGVHFSDEKKKFVAHSVVAPGEKGKFLGYFKTPEEAFAAYKKCKESLIKIIADQQRLHIPDKLYQALINYRVEIGD
jgi:L-amino acid N-acyltransferase YncA